MRPLNCVKRKKHSNAKFIKMRNDESHGATKKRMMRENNEQV